MLSAIGVSALLVVGMLVVAQILAKLAFPGLVPKGLTTIILVVMTFGAVNLAAVALLGEYAAKIFEEVKRRPLFLRRSIIRDGEVRDASEDLPQVSDPEALH